MWTVKEDPIRYYEYEPKLCYRTDKLYYDRSITTDQTGHNNRPDA